MSRKYIYQEKATVEYLERRKKIKRTDRCYMCGYYFQVGDLISCLNNNIGTDDRPRGFFNPTICEDCDEGDILTKWANHCRVAAEKFWWMESR